MDWRFTLAEPVLDNQEIEAVTEVLKSKWLTMGPKTKAFEEKFAAMHGAKHAFAVSNATAALHIANMALGISPEDEVLCPALTFVASANASKYAGAKVSFVDSISNSDLTIDPEDIKAKITPKTKAITVVHYAGFACKMEEIKEIAENHGLKIIEDCAHAPLGKYRSKNGSLHSVGTIGDVGCFSFFGNKNMTTGEGGMITTNDDGIAEKIRLLRSHGMTTLTYDRHKGHASSYDVVALGYNYRLDELHAAIGLVQLEKLNENNQKRRDIFSWYQEALKDVKSISIPFQNHRLEDGVPHIVSLIYDGDAYALRQALLEKRIQTSKHYPLVPSFTAFKDESFKSKINTDGLLTVPLSPQLTKDNVYEIVSEIKESISKIT